MIAEQFETVLKAEAKKVERTLTELFEIKPGKDMDLRRGVLRKIEVNALRLTEIYGTLASYKSDEQQAYLVETSKNFERAGDIFKMRLELEDKTDRGPVAESYKNALRVLSSNPQTEESSDVRESVARLKRKLYKDCGYIC